MRKIQLVSLIFPALLLSACSSTSLQDDAGSKGGEKLEPQRTCCINPDSLRKQHDDPASILFKRSVYFDFDQYTIKDEFKPLAEAHAKYLASHRDIKVVVIGNTDERGGREYNLALGQKRAEAVRKALALLSVPESQVEAVSLGKEKPKATGSDEASWAENRRSDIVYQ